MRKSFRVFGTKEDLEKVFSEFQKNNTIKYYKCGKEEDKAIQDITQIDKFGISTSGSHIGNQYLIVNSNEIVKFDKYQHLYQRLNETSIVIDIGGLYDENTLLPTETATMWYENENSKKIYNELKKVFKRYCVMTVNGYLLLENAYNKKANLRFVTIDVKSPREYDLKV